jgi:glutamine synthetase
LKPVYFVRDPFREFDNIIVLCESWVWADENFTTMKPANTNFRHYAERIFNSVKNQETWYGIEQEYSLLEVKNMFTIKPLGWPSSGFPGP